MSESSQRAASAPKRGHSRLHRILRVLIPVAVSVLLFLYLFSRIDVRAVVDSISLPIILRWGVPLLLFNLVTLMIEAHCLHRVAGAAGVQLDRLVAQSRRRPE